MVHYQFIAAPAEKTKRATLENLQAKVAVAPNDLCEVFAFDIPDFKVGYDDIKRVDVGLTHITGWHTGQFGGDGG